MVHFFKIFFLQRIRWIWHPISILIIAQVCWGLLMFVWIRWYLLRSAEINFLIEKLPIGHERPGQWVILAQGCILMAFLLLGLYMIFVSQRRLSRITKMQDAILSSVTHELKTPLASIRLYTETMLLRTVGAEEQKKFLKRTLLEAERLQKLVDTVLISARLESSPIMTMNTRVNLIEILTSCFSRIKERFSEERQIEFRIDPHILENSLFVLGNIQHLSTLFDNLLDNAVKYTTFGGAIELFVTHKKDFITVMITDNGLGIEKKDLKKIFKKFYRVEGNNRSKIKGSGLGLSVCRSIVKEHGGRIFVTSLGHHKGSSFYVELKGIHPYH